MEICIGEYVRTKKGKIDKVINNNYYMSQYIECEKGIVDKENIVKHSKIISEVVEVGDYVNKEEIIEVRKQNGKIYLMTSYCPQNYIKHEIKEILTKEQYMKNCYTVEREEEC